MEIRYDKRQTEAIRVRSNAVIMAGAGSGKTAVISERYCRLLEDGNIGIDRILALTFTQKAAAEMHERIYNRMAHGSAGLQKHLQSFEQAQISTLDSFCAEILSNSADSFGLPQDFRYDEQAVGRVAEKTSLEFLLENLTNPAIGQLLHIHGFETLWKQLFGDLARSHLHLPGEFAFQAMAHAQIDRCCTDLREMQKTADGLFKEIHSLDARTVSIRSAQTNLAAFPGILEDLEADRYTPAAEKLNRLKLKKPGGRGGEDIRRLKELIDQLRPVLLKLGTLSATLAQKQLLLEASVLLEDFSERFIDRKRSLGLITYQDAAKVAVQALIRDQALRQFYKTRYRFIMIDEFQDNNRLQKDLLFLLAEKLGVQNEGVPPVEDLEPDKLFFVGDEKQSIYRFRGAEVGVFKSLHEELNSVGGRTIALDSNYRSESALIEFVNGVFSVVMADAGAPYEARYQRMKKGGTDNNIKAQIHLFYGNQEKTPDPDHAPPNLAEAYAVVDFIHRSVEERALTIQSEQGPRPAAYNDFAVLLRSTGNQIHYERMFRHFSVPYSTENLRSLFTEPPINDFYLLLQLAVYPEDRTAYAGLLRSPFVNISDETLIRLLLEGGQPFSGLEALRMKEQDRRRLQQGSTIYADIRAGVDRIPIAEIFHRLWYRYGYRYTILRNPDNHNYLEYYDYMVELAERADRQGDTLAAFLDFLRQNLGRYERIDDLTVLRSRLPGVQLLTIHRSKGLEFPIVVLADMGNLGRRYSGGSKPYYLSSQYGITFNLGARNYFTEIGEAESEKEEVAEIKRLLYVALTRAQSHLVLAGTHKLRNRSTPRAHLNLLLDGLGLSGQSLSKDSSAAAQNGLEIHNIAALPWRSLDGTSQAKHGIAAGSRDGLYAGTPTSRSTVRRDISVTELCGYLDILAEQAKPKPATTAIQLPPIPADALIKERDLESRFGILTHQLLEQWGADPGGPSPEPDWTRAGILMEYRERLLAGAVRLCRNFFDSRLGALSAEAKRIDRELPFLYLYEDDQGPLYISGQIDLVFESQDRLYLVDFKTDRFYKPGEHDSQLGLYQLALREQTDKQILTFLFLLRSGEAVQADPEIEVAKLLPGVRQLL